MQASERASEHQQKEASMQARSAQWANKTCAPNHAINYQLFKSTISMPWTHSTNCKTRVPSSSSSHLGTCILVGLDDMQRQTAEIEVLQMHGKSDIMMLTCISSQSHRLYINPWFKIPTLAPHGWFRVELCRACRCQNTRKPNKSSQQNTPNKSSQTNRGNQKNRAKQNTRKPNKWADQKTKETKQIEPTKHTQTKWNQKTNKVNKTKPTNGQTKPTIQTTKQRKPIKPQKLQSE